MSLKQIKESIDMYQRAFPKLTITHKIYTDIYEHLVYLEHRPDQQNDLFSIIQFPETDQSVGHCNPETHLEIISKTAQELFREYSDKGYIFLTEFVNDYAFVSDGFIGNMKESNFLLGCVKIGNRWLVLPRLAINFLLSQSRFLNRHEKGILLREKGKQILEGECHQNNCSD